ncbi:hypothetical protein ABZ922_41060 [Streptomyces shenzhenensis]
MTAVKRPRTASTSTEVQGEHRGLARTVRLGQRADRSGAASP